MSEEMFTKKKRKYKKSFVNPKNQYKKLGNWFIITSFFMAAVGIMPGILIGINITVNNNKQVMALAGLAIMTGLLAYKSMNIYSKTLNKLLSTNSSKEQRKIKTT